MNLRTVGYSGIFEKTTAIANPAIYFKIHLKFDDMINIHIRPATEADLPVLFSFEQQLILAERPFDPTLKPDKIHYYDLEALVQSPDACVLVAENESGIIASGYIKIKVAEPFLQHTEFGYLGFMFVVPEWRGKGLNRMIVDKLVEWGKKKNLNEFRLDVYEKNRSAIAGYLKAGFVSHMLEMRLIL